MKMITYNAFLLSFLALLLFCSCRQPGNHTVEGAIDSMPPCAVTIDTSHLGLRIYYPPTDSVVLRCFSRPDPAVNQDIVFCCAAAFTLDYNTVPDHKRICGAHVSDGQYWYYQEYKSGCYTSERYTGAFVSYNGEWWFLYHADADPAAFHSAFEEAAINHGAGFAQEMMIHQGGKVKTTRPLTDSNLFRALCEIDHRLCVIDATEVKPFGDFIDSLIDAGVTEAIYTDMGYGWNYSWYRECSGDEAVFIHPAYQECATNWLVFYVVD